MESVRLTIAKNINTLRTKQGMTQLELAERLNYSDKAISKWERAESTPDAAVLVQLADLFGVTLDQLMRGENLEAAPPPQKTKVRSYRRGLITGLSILCVWLVVTAAFVLLSLTQIKRPWNWTPFLYAVPVSLIVWLVLNSIWFDRKWNYWLISALMWTMLAAIVVTLTWAGCNVWLIFLLGIPGQLGILVWSGLGKEGVRRFSRRALHRETKKEQARETTRAE